MADSNSIKMGKAHVEVGGDESKLVGVLAAVGAKVQEWGAGVMKMGAAVTGVGLAITAPFIAAVEVFSEMGSELQDASDRTGISVQALSELKHAAEQSSASLGDLQGALRKMAIKLAEAAGGSQEARSALADLGLNINDLKDLSPDRQFEMIADKIAEIENPAQRAAAATAIFGRGATQMMPLLRAGADGIRALREEARELGLDMSGPDAASAEALGDKLANLAKQLKAMVFQVGAAVAPIAHVFLDVIVGAAASVIRLLRENRELIKTIFLIGVGITAAGVAIVSFGALLFGTGVAISTLATIVMGVKAAFLALSAGIAAVLSPVGLIIAGFGLAAVAGLALGAAILHAFDMWPTIIEGATSLFGSLTPQILAMGATFSTTWGGIMDSLMAGDLAGAANIAWLGIQLAWTQGINLLEREWVTFKNGILAIWDEIGDTVVSTMQGIAQAWVASISVALDTAISIVNRAIDALPAWARDASGVSRIDFSSADLAESLGGALDSLRPQEGDSMARTRAFNDMLSRQGADEQALRDELELQAGLADLEAQRVAINREMLGAGTDEAAGLDLGGGGGGVLGSFSAQTLSGFTGGRSPIDQVAENTELTNEILAHIRSLLAEEGDLELVAT